MLKKVILCPNPYRDHELTVAKEAKRILDSVHCPNVVCVPFRNEEKPEGYGLDIRPLQQELRGADMIIAFGGDGTILHLSKTAAHRDIPVLGVNLGSLGFMAELESSELKELRRLADDDFSVEPRMMLHVRAEHEGRVILEEDALNDAVITKGAVARVVQMSVQGDGVDMMSFSGDGLIVCTPTGSTAYSMAARWSSLLHRILCSRRSAPTICRHVPSLRLQTARSRCSLPAPAAKTPFFPWTAARLSA